MSSRREQWLQRGEKTKFAGRKHGSLVEQFRTHLLSGTSVSNNQGNGWQLLDCDPNYPLSDEPCRLVSLLL